MSAPLIRLNLDGATVDCPEGLVLTELLGRRAPAWRRSPRLGAPRGMFCGMGLCFECLVEIDGRPARACLARARAGMVIRTGLVPEGGA